MAMASSSDTLLSQELFDETVLENEECFDLSPDEALRETIDQFRQQLGVTVDRDGDYDVTNDDDDDEGARSPTSVAANSSGSRGDINVVALAVPAALSHLVLSYPDSVEGRRDREARRRFRSCLELLDARVRVDGTVNVSGNDTAHGDGDGDDVRAVLGALAEVGRRCRLGDDDCENSGRNGAPLPYLAMFQRTSSIYTLMSFMGVVDPKRLVCHGNAGDDADCNRILKATARALSSVLVVNPERDDGRCVRIRAELRDSFVPALSRLVHLVGGFVGALSFQVQQRADGTNFPGSSSSLTESSTLCDLLRLGTDATRGCEGAKVVFVQSTLPAELSVPSNANTKRGGVAVLVSCLMLSFNNGNDTTSFNKDSRQLMTEACQMLASLCRYDDFRDPSAASGGAMGAAGVNASSAHDHAMEFHRAGAATSLIKIARFILSRLDKLGSRNLEGSPSFSEGKDKEELATRAVDEERLAAAVLTALRVLAINDEVVQTMVALGVLPIVTKALRLAVVSVATTENREENANLNDGTSRTSGDGGAVVRQRLAAASLGLLRNLCGNDEIKTNLCLGSADQCSRSSTPSVLPHLLQAMQTFPSTALLQEHACGTLAAMALRRPANARAILDEGGPRPVLSAMRRHSENVGVQRQGALAIRNVVSRLLRCLPEDGGAASANKNKESTAATGHGKGDENQRDHVRDAFLELGAEDVLRNIAGRHQGSVDEAYAALRDLGCAASLVKFDAEELRADQGRTGSAIVGVGRTMMFGEKHNSNFRPVYEESRGLSEGVDNAISQFGT